MGLPSIGGNAAQVMSPGATQVVTSTGASVQSATPSSGVVVWRLCADADCFCLVGSAPVATSTNGFPMPAGRVEYISNPTGKLAVISKAGTANMFITDMT